MAATLGEATVYRAVVAVRVNGCRAVQSTGTVLTDSGKKPREIKKLLAEEISQRFSGGPYPVDVKVTELKKLRGGFFTML